MGKKSREKQERKQRGSENENMDLLTVNEAAEILRVHPKTIRNWMKEGSIDYVLLGPAGGNKKSYRIRRKEITQAVVNPR